MIVAAYRDGGFWPLFWQLCSSAWTSGLPGSFPPRGFVGRGSSSSVVSDLAYCKLKSIRLRRVRFIHAVPRWRLTLEWETSLPPSRALRCGPSSVKDGGAWVAGGGASFRRRTTTILTSQQQTFSDQRVPESLNRIGASQPSTGRRD